MRQIQIQHYFGGDGVEYGRVVKPSEMVALQEFAHEHVELITRDFLMQGAVSAAVAGFAYTLANGLSLLIAPGQAVNPQGLNFETLPPGEAAIAQLPAAHPTLPRIDTIYCAMSVDQDAEPEPLPHRRLRTPVEEGQGLDPYAISNFNVPTQLHNRATVGAIQGIAANVPVAPAVGANQIALFHVRVEAGAVALTHDKITDVRPLIRSLTNALTQIDAINAVLPGLVQNDQGFAERVDNRVAALIDWRHGLTGLYDNAGNVLHVDLSAGEPVAGSVLRGMVAGGSEWHALNNADITTALNYTPVNKAGDSTGPLIVYPTINPTPVTPSTALTVHGNTGGGNDYLFKVRGVDATAVVGVPRSGLRMELFGDHFGNSGTAWLDWFNTFTWGKWDVHNAMHFDCTRFATGAHLVPGRAAFRFKAASRAAALGDNGADIILSVARADDVDVFKVDQSGNASVLGNFTAASKTFFIDHPLQPGNKNLRHAVVEAPRADLLYRGRITISGGEQVEVDLDTLHGMTPGTFAALTKNVDVLLFNLSDGLQPRVDGGLFQVATGVFSIEIVGGAPEGEAEPTQREVTFLVLAERDDAIMHALAETDAAGSLICETNKPVPTAQMMAVLDDDVRTEYVVGDGEQPIESVAVELVSALIGFQGYPMHAALTGGAQPTRQATITKVDTNAPIIHSITRVPGIIEQTATGDDDWADLANLSVADGTAASCVLTGTWSSETIILRDFDSPIPDNATITGCAVTIKRRRVGGVVSDLVVRLDTLIGASSNKALLNQVWSPVNSAVTYGGQSDTWNLELTPAVVNDPGLALKFRATDDDGAGTALVDLISGLTIYYTMPEGEAEV